MRIKRAQKGLAVMLSLFVTLSVTNLTTYAETTQTENWYQENGIWKVKDSEGNILKDTWFCDLDDSWYLIDEQGCMREGLINDNGHYYSLETAHEEHYGKMRTANGNYNGVYLTFNQEHNGYYGEVISGIEEMLKDGIKITEVKGLSDNMVYAKDFISAQLSNTATSGDSQISDNQNNNNSRVGKGLGGHGVGYTPGDESHFIVGG